MMPYTLVWMRSQRLGKPMSHGARCRSSSRGAQTEEAVTTQAALVKKLPVSIRQFGNRCCWLGPI